MVHELTKEIASSDRIDFLISFIRFSGLQLLLPALRLFTARGGHLRIVTTTYMGATDPKAIEVLASLPHTEVRISYDVKETDCTPNHTCSIGKAATRLPTSVHRIFPTLPSQKGWSGI